MNLKSKRTVYFFLVTVLLLISCDVSSFVASQQVPTPIPGVIDLIVAQTAGAAATQTAAQIPPTLTPTLTPFPTQTLISGATDIPTYIYLTETAVTFTPFPTMTKFVSSGGGGGVATSIGGSKGGGSKPPPAYSCHLLSQIPLNGSFLTAGQNIIGDWMVRNNGTKTWYSLGTGIKFVNGTNYSSGSFFVYTFSKPVASGDNVTLQLPPMTAPLVPGKYVSRWNLVIGTKNFCRLQMNITVQ